MDLFYKFDYQSPHTKKPLHWQELGSLSNRGECFVIDNGKLNFLKNVEKQNSIAPSENGDSFNNLKSTFKKRLGAYYVTLVYLISPVMPRFSWNPFGLYYKTFIDRITSECEKVIQVGSGNDRLNSKTVNIDMMDYPEVDIVADCTNLPFKDSSVDAIISIAVLEHVKNPEVFLKEAFRVLKPEGVLITGVPFLQGFHASPHDYYRWTHHGLVSFHEKHGFSKVALEPLAGPTSSLLWIATEWISIFMSFNIKLLYHVVFYTLLLVLWPLKIFDLVLIHYDKSYLINSFFLYAGRKNLDTEMESGSVNIQQPHGKF